MPPYPSPFPSAAGRNPDSEIAILWLTAGLGCDGDTIALTGATQPSLEELLGGGIPWTPKVTLYNPFLAPENGDEFLRHYHRGASGELGRFILVVEGSVPDEGNKAAFTPWRRFSTAAATAPIPTR